MKGIATAHDPVPAPLPEGSTLLGLPGEDLAKLRWYRPRVRLVRLPDGGRAVVKDFRTCPLFWRATYGRILTWRETRAYARLVGIEGIPRFLGRLDRYAVALEWAPGVPIAKCPKGSLGVETFDRLAAIVRAMHERGVVHMDLRQRKNILIDETGAPWIIDFSSSISVDPRTRIGRWLLHRCRRIDSTGVLKNKRRFVPEALTEREKMRLRRFERGRRLWPF